MKLGKINKYTIGQTHSDDLRKALSVVTDKAKRQMILDELEARRVAGVNRPLTLEDMLG